MEQVFNLLLSSHNFVCSGVDKFLCIIHSPQPEINKKFCLVLRNVVCKQKPELFLFSSPFFFNFNVHCNVNLAIWIVFWVKLLLLWHIFSFQTEIIEIFSRLWWKFTFKLLWVVWYTYLPSTYIYLGKNKFQLIYIRDEFFFHNELLYLLIITATI